MQEQRLETGVDAYADDELVRLFRESRQTKYFDELFHRHGRAVFRSCLAFHRNAAAAEEVTQDTFLRAHQSLDGFTGGDFLAWLLRIARNGCIDRWRRARPEIGYDEAPAEAFAAPSQRVGSAVHLALLQLEDELATLPANQRRCLELKAAGFSYEEMAAEIGSSADEVRSHLQNGRRTLRLRMANTLVDVL